MLDFLSNSIHLVAITPDGPLTGRNFGGDHAGAMEWARAQTGANVYFTVNEVSPAFQGTKPTKSDILQARFAHVDIDPPEGGEWDRDAALLALMAQNPTVIIDSGNGWQGLWALTHHTDDIETINRGIAHALGADPRIHNIDRLFRVPDTTNWPNAVKRAKGRMPQPTALILYEPSLTYDPEALLAHYPAPVRVTRAAEGVYDGPYEEDYDPPLPSNELRDLLWADIPPGSRSEHAARVAHRMGREGYSYPQILGTLLNPQWPWAGTIQDQADPERQARRKLAGVVVWPKGEDMFPDDEPRAAVVREPPTVTRARAAGFSGRDGGWMPQDDQINHFKGCVYVTLLDKVLMPDGTLLNQSRFDATMGGYKFAIGASTEDQPTKSAWEAFLKNQRYTAPTAYGLCFRPEEPQGAIIQDGSITMVNTWVPIETPRAEGDPTPFLLHMSKLFPDERDRTIMLTYMASCIQNPGMKAQWWPVVQGVQGNGKTLLLNVMEFCIGPQYSHLPNAAKMTRNGVNFNGWIAGKLFLGLEEVYSATRRDFLEEFKPYVTNRRLPIEGKGQDEYTGDNRANGLLLTNHRDGVPIDDNERRYAPFFTAQQSREDMVRDGMTSEYFSHLWNWLRYGGYAIVNHYLSSYECVAEFDPAQLATRAPRTSSTDEAIVAGRGTAEQAILLAIEEGRPGFSGGWISSKALDTLLKENRIRVPPNKWSGLLAPLRYTIHPGLVEGKTPGVVQPDGVRCRLYIKEGHISRGLDLPANVVDAYTKAQLKGDTERAESRLGA